MSAETFKQEMPPTGGYRPLNFERTFAKRYLTFGKCMVLLIAPSVIWLYLWRKEKRYRFVKELEYRSHFIPIEPCLFAERDREYLKQLIRNKEEEADLMKNVPYWEVGKLYDEKVFRTIPEDVLIGPDVNEYYIHTRYEFLSEYYHFDQRR